MKTQSLDLGWSLQVQGGSRRAAEVMVNLPHDWSITAPRKADAASGASGGFFQGAELHYERTFFMEEGIPTVLLEFEGVYCNAEVRINGQLVKVCHYGYSGFLADVSEQVKRGCDNRLKVVVNANARPDSRWYTGAGIYRHVWLHTAGSTCIHPWGLTVETKEVLHEVPLTLQGNGAYLTAVVDLQGTVTDEILHITIRDREGQVVLETECPAENGTVRCPLCLPKARLWTAETPYLYTICCTLTGSNTESDQLSIPFGVRTISMDSIKGLCINGQTVKLRGGCVHHDNGILGAASFDKAEERKVRLMKENGYNAVRCAHNPPAPAFLRACDTLGMYVMDESFDVWREGKNPYDYHNFFDMDWKKDMAAMVLRDRCHPSVILWSIGNEIPERDGRINGYETARELYDYVKELDSSRPVMNCLCNVSTNTEITGLEANMMKDDPDYDLWAVRTRPFTEFLDAVGYNYLLSRYETDAEKFPGRVVCGTESFPMQAADNWAAVDCMSHVIGDFVWTAIDYLGESGLGHVKPVDDKGFLRAYPWHLANCGDIDICGHKRPQSYYRDAVWGLDREEGHPAPCITVIPPCKWNKTVEISAWGWPEAELRWDFTGWEGMEAGIWVYSSWDEVELFLNGVSLGRKPAGVKAGFKTLFAQVYEPGELKAVGYRKGRPAGEQVLVTPEPAAALVITAEKNGLKDINNRLAAGYQDIVYIDITAVDDSGVTVTGFEQEISLSVTGAARLQAMGTAVPWSEEDYTGPRRSAYLGRVTAVIRAHGEGDIQVTASAQGIPEAVMTFSAE